jgi:hypothetical protein
MAFVIGGAWVAHMTSGAHANEASDDDCQVCAVSCSPTLNADCGTVLLAAPEKFELISPGPFINTVSAESHPVFQGRAPPLV